MTTGRDLTLSDQFHRLKRTTVLAASAVIITFIPQIELAVAGTLSPLAKVDPNLVRALLWIVATYYCGGFILEFYQERAAHAGTLASDSLKSLQHTAARLQEAVQGRLDELRNATLTFDKLAALADTKIDAELAQSRTLDIYQTVRRVATRADGNDLLVSLSAASAPANRQMQNDYVRMFAELVSKELTSGASWPLFSNSVEAEIHKVTQTLDRIEQFVPNSAETIAGSVRSLRQFGDGSLRISVIYFFGWELGGALFIWLLSTALFFAHSDLPAAVNGLWLMITGGAPEPWYCYPQRVSA